MAEEHDTSCNTFMLYPDVIPDVITPEIRMPYLEILDLCLLIVVRSVFRHTSGDQVHFEWSQFRAEEIADDEWLYWREKAEEDHQTRLIELHGF